MQNPGPRHRPCSHHRRSHWESPTCTANPTEAEAQVQLLDTALTKVHTDCTRTHVVFSRPQLKFLNTILQLVAMSHLAQLGPTRPRAQSCTALVRKDTCQVCSNPSTVSTDWWLLFATLQIPVNTVCIDFLTCSSVHLFICLADINVMISALSALWA